MLKEGMYTVVAGFQAGVAWMLVLDLDLGKLFLELGI